MAVIILLQSLIQDVYCHHNIHQLFNKNTSVVFTKCSMLIFQCDDLSCNNVMYITCVTFIHVVQLVAIQLVSLYTTLEF